MGVLVGADVGLVVGAWVGPEVAATAETTFELVLGPADLTGDLELADTTVPRLAAANLKVVTTTSYVDDALVPRTVAYYKISVDGIAGSAAVRSIRSKRWVRTSR